MTNGNGISDHSRHQVTLQSSSLEALALFKNHPEDALFSAGKRHGIHHPDAGKRPP